MKLALQLGYWGAHPPTYLLNWQTVQQRLGVSPPPPLKPLPPSSEPPKLCSTQSYRIWSKASFTFALLFKNSENYSSVPPWGISHRSSGQMPHGTPLLVARRFLLDARTAMLKDSLTGFKRWATVSTSMGSHLLFIRMHSNFR